MANDFGTAYTYVDPETGETVSVSGAEGHHDQFGVLMNEATGNGWVFECPQQTHREAEFAIETLQSKRPGTVFQIVELS
ncbi:MAG: hypothetical protein ACTH1D_12905, partial [Mycobacteriaceae bacterium]